MNDSPKIRFLKSKEDVEFHANITADPRFIRAVDAAMLQMIYSETGDSNDGQASCKYNMLAGASNFVRVFTNLSKVAEEVKRPFLPSLIPTDKKPSTK